mgnify:CR=1 FL=1
MKCDEIFAALAMLEKERGIPRGLYDEQDRSGPDHRL